MTGPVVISPIQRPGSIVIKQDQGPQGPPGPKGDPGEDGMVVRFNGSGPPPSVIPGAMPGDLYLDLLTGDLYQLT